MKLKIITVILLFQVSQVRPQGLDVNILDKLNPQGSKGADKAMNFISDATIPVSVATPIAMYTIGLIAYDQALKENALKTGVSLAATTAITYAMKSSFDRQRPFLTYPDRITSSADAKGHSFPSGHTSTAFSLATSLSLSYPKWYVIVPSYTFAAATAYSRMYKGVHYPSDVLGGTIVGAGTSYLTWKVQKLLQKKPSSQKRSGRYNRMQN